MNFFKQTIKFPLRWKKMICNNDDEQLIDLNLKILTHLKFTGAFYS